MQHNVTCGVPFVILCLKLSEGWGSKGVITCHT